MVSGYNRRGLEENEVENQVGRISMVEFLVSSEIYRAISWPTPGLKKQLMIATGFPTERTFISTSSVLLEWVCHCHVYLCYTWVFWLILSVWPAYIYIYIYMYSKMHKNICIAWCIKNDVFYNQIACCRNLADQADLDKASDRWKFGIQVLKSRHAWTFVIRSVYR